MRTYNNYIKYSKILSFAFHIANSVYEFGVRGFSDIWMTSHLSV